MFFQLVCSDIDTKKVMFKKIDFYLFPHNTYREKLSYFCKENTYLIEVVVLGQLGQ